MFEVFKRLADPSFMPHGHCYLWKPEILWTHVVSDAVIGIAYFTIPIVLAVFLAKRKAAIPYPHVVTLFCGFILLCGLTHVAGIIVTWYPAYEPQGWLKAVTAVVSIYTAIVLVPLLPELLALPDLKQAYQRTQEALIALQERNQKLNAFYEITVDREERILELKTEINDLLKQQGKPARYALE